MLSAQLKEKVREKMCLLCDEVAHFDTTPDKWWVPTTPDGLFQPLKTNDNKESVFLCVYLWQFVHLGTFVSKSFIQRRAKPMPDTWSVALRNAADYPYNAARESVRIYTSEVRQEKVIRHVILRWRSITIHPFHFVFLLALTGHIIQNLLLFCRNSRGIHEFPRWEYLIYFGRCYYAHKFKWWKQTRLCKTCTKPAYMLMPVFYQLQDRQQQGKTLQNSITTPTLGAFQDWTVDNHLFWMHRRWAGNLKGEGGNILIGNKMEIIYSSSPRYPADFHPAGNKRSSFLTCPSPLLLQLSIPFDFMPKICKSETYISL